MITEHTPLSELIEMVQTEVAKLLPDEDVTVSSLFKGYEWKRLPLSVRTKLGSIVLVMAENGTLDIEPVAKSAQKQQIYRKK